MSSHLPSAYEYHHSQSEPRPWGYVSSSTLVLFAFATAYFPRVAAGLGIPSFINFLHFLVVPIICVYVLQQVRLRDQQQINTIRYLISGLLILLAVIMASALINSAGVINVFLDYMLLAEPFLLLIAIVSLPMSPSGLDKFRRQWQRFSLINLLFAICQFLVLRLDTQNADLIKGVFIDQGSGHVVGGSISLTFGVYYFASATNRPLWIRLAIALASVIHVVKADVKQALAVFLMALIVLIFLKAKNFVKFLQYVVMATLLVGVIILLANTVFRALLIWSDLDVQREGLALKMSGFSILPTFYKSPLNWFLGLGPGHTIGRLGGWMVWEYGDLLGPLGLTKSRATVAVWSVATASWLGDKSSWFLPLFGWAGIWGDLGFLGLGTYLSIWLVIWHRLCLDDLSKFFTLTVLLYGLIMSQLEEPGYMLFMTGIIALCWQTQQIKKLQSPYWMQSTA